MESLSCLLELDADLANAVEDPLRRRRAYKSITAAVRTLGPGEALDTSAIVETAPLGMLLLEGFLVRELVTSGRVSADLLGPEDLLQPLAVAQHGSPLRYTAQWTAATFVRLALLDGDFLRRSAQWPEISAALIERAGRPGRRLVSCHAIATMPSVDMRLLASLWEWASHWGVVERSGVRLDLPLSHARIGHLIGAQRPTVTAALGRLRRTGLLEQRAPGAWLLCTPASGPGGADEQGLRMPAFDHVQTPSRIRLGRRAVAERGESQMQQDTPSPQADREDDQELQRRLARQREAFHAASARHEQMLERLQEESSQLRVNSAALAQLARRRREDRAGDDAEPASGEPDRRSAGVGTYDDGGDGEES